MSSLKLLRNFQKQAEKASKKRKKPAVCGYLQKESEKSGHFRIRDQKAAANEGSVFPVGSAEGKRPEFVSAKRAASALRARAATIEIAERS